VLDALKPGEDLVALQHAFDTFGDEQEESEAPAAKAEEVAPEAPAKTEASAEEEAPAESEETPAEAAAEAPTESEEEAPAAEETKDDESKSDK